MPVSSLLAHAVLLARLAAPYPFGVGETLRYEARLGFVPVGGATVAIPRMAQERGREAFVLTAAGEGGPPGVRVRYELTSWVGTGPFHSLRFHRRVIQGSRVEERRYQIVPDSLRYREEGVAQDWTTPADPLDELAFLYYLRTIPLEVGRSYTLARYFHPGYNPVRVTVTGRQAVALGDGTAAPCLALQVTTRGVTGNIWLTDDARRLPAQLDVPLWFGNVRLVLTGAPAATR